VRSLPCDVQLGDHPSQFNLQAKYAKLRPGGANPYIEPESCLFEADIQEAMYHATLEEQKKAAQP
jgi:metallo-beta-lactamase class B